MVHAEELDLVAGRALERGDVLHVGLGPTAAVEELVDVEDAHGDPWGAAPAGRHVPMVRAAPEGRLKPV